MKLAMLTFTALCIVAALTGCGTTGGARDNSFYNVMCSGAMDELGLCPYNRF